MSAVIEKTIPPGTHAGANGHRPLSAKWIVCILRSEKLSMVTDALNKLNLVGGMTVTDLRGVGHEEREKGVFHGQTFTHTYISKVKIELAIEADDVNRVEEIIAELARTGEVG